MKVRSCSRGFARYTAARTPHSLDCGALYQLDSASLCPSDLAKLAMHRRSRAVFRASAARSARARSVTSSYTTSELIDKVAHIYFSGVNIVLILLPA